LETNVPRSPALAINRETGEPSVVPSTYEKYEAWKVVILDIETNQRRSKKFFSYKKAKKAAIKYSEKLGPAYLVGVVSRQMGYGPPQSKVPDLMLVEKNDLGYLWCPYCRNFRTFLYNAWRERRLCEFCGCVESDFHVVVNNPMFWDPERVKRIRENG